MIRKEDFKPIAFELYGVYKWSTIYELQRVVGFLKIKDDGVLTDKVINIDWIPAYINEYGVLDYFNCDHKNFFGFIDKKPLQSELKEFCDKKIKKAGQIYNSTMIKITK